MKRRSTENGLIRRGSPYRTLVNSKVSSLGTPAAVMVQIANAGIAKSLVDAGGMETDPSARVKRTLVFATAIAMGTGEQGEAAIQAIQRAHHEIPRAHNPSLQRLVWATIFDKEVAALRRYGPGFTDEQAEEAWADSSFIQERIGLPGSEQHRSFADASAFVAQQEARLTVTEDSLKLSPLVMRPSIPLLKPMGPLIRHVTAELLSPRMAESYGLVAGRHKEFERLIETSGRLFGPFAGSTIYQALAGRYAGRELTKMFGPSPEPTLN